MMKIAVGSDNFYKMVTEGAMVVDKTALIKEISDDGSEVLLFTRWRRGGKTLAMRMLQAFYAATVDGQSTKKLFDKFAIANIDGGKYMQEQGKYPVIFISFKDVQGKDFNTCFKEIALAILNLYDNFFKSLSKEEKEKLGRLPQKIYDDLLKDPPDQASVEQSLKILSQCLYEYSGNKGVYILIDEYDKPLNAAYKKPYFDQLSGFMRNLFGAALKGNPYLKKGIMTGILRISKGEMLSSLNNLKEYTVLDSKYAPYFGFTPEEVTALFKQAGIVIDESKVSDWFNGYKVGGLVILNPWSIMNCLEERGNLRAYWVDTADDSLIRDSLVSASDNLKKQLATLMQGKSIEATVNKHITFENISRDETGFWSLLLFAGYLRAEKAEFNSTFNIYNCVLSIPNKEVLSLYNNLMINWFAQRLGGEESYRLFIQKLLKGDADGFGKDLGGYLLRCASVHDMARQPEAFYHGFVLALLAGIQEDYIISSNKESGLGRYDVMIIPKPHIKSDLAIILEFKHAKENQIEQEVAKEALKQIDDNLYEVQLSDHSHIKNVLKMGLAFSGKSVVYAYKTTDLTQKEAKDSEIRCSQELFRKEYSDLYDFEDVDEEEGAQKLLKKESSGSGDLIILKGKKKRVVDSDEEKKGETQPVKKQKAEEFNLYKFFTPDSTSSPETEEGKPKETESNKSVILTKQTGGPTK